MLTSVFTSLLSFWLLVAVVELRSDCNLTLENMMQSWGYPEEGDVAYNGWKSSGVLAAPSQPQQFRYFVLYFLKVRKYVFRLFYLVTI